MFQLRRTAFRLIANPSSPFVSRARSIATISQSAFRSSRQTSFAPSFQRRWASEEAQNAQGGETPIEKVEPAPQEEAENAAQSAEAGAKSAVDSVKDVAQNAMQSAVETVRGATGAAARTADFGDDSFDPNSPKPNLYIGNLFFDVSEVDLKNEFSRFGPVASVNIVRDGRGLSKGFGYLAFESVDDATKALEAMDQSVFEGRRISIQYAKAAIRTPGLQSNTLNPPCKTLFIGNMSFEMTDRDLNNLFKGVKNVIDVRVAIDRRSGQPRGFAHADFIDVKSAIEAQKELKDKESHGRRLRVDFSRSGTRRSSQSSDASDS